MGALLTHSGYVPQYIDKLMLSGVSGTPVVNNKPAGVIENDLMLSFLIGEGAMTWSGDTGWNEDLDDSNNSHSHRLGSKIAGGAEGSSYSFAATGTGNAGAKLGGIYAYRSAKVGPVSASVGRVVSPTTSVDAPGITALAGKLLLVHGYRHNAGTPIVVNTPAGFTIKDSLQNSLVWVTIFEKDVGPGATGNINVSMAAAPTGMSAYLVNIKGADA